MKKTYNKGFTLVELIIVLALVAIVLPLIFQLYVYGQETFAHSNKFIAQQFTITNVMDHIRGDIQSAASVSVIPPTGPDVYPKAITLKLGYYDDSDTPVVATYKYWRFYCRVPGEEGRLQYGGERNPAYTPADADYSDTVTGLDINNCNFERKASTPDCDRLIIEIKPIETNTGKAIGSNLREPIKTEISVLYKD